MSLKSLKVGATLNEFLNKELKYQAQVEPKAFRLYANLVKHSDLIYQAENKKLESQKQKLFAQGYSAAWQIKDEAYDVTRQYDREYSNQFMLPAETERIKNLSDELQFFTEQLWREIRRIVDDNVQL